RIAARMLAAVAAAVALVEAAGVSIARAGGPGRLLRIGRTDGARPRAGIRQVAFARRRPARRAGVPRRVLARVARAFASTGQLAADPVQFSAGSHSPAENRHVVVAGSKASFGQTVLVPVQLSATS